MLQHQPYGGGRGRSGGGDFHRGQIPPAAICEEAREAGILHQLHEKAVPAPETVYSEIETFPGYAAGAAGQNPLLPGEIRRLTLDELLRCLDICA